MVPGGDRWSSPGEAYLTLMEDSLFDRFFETYRETFTDKQIQCWKELRQRLEEYYDKLPKHPDPRLVLADPEWEDVREAARRFVDAFSHNSGSRQPSAISS
jgi:hypothetical protein